MGGPVDDAGTGTAPGFDSFNFFNFSEYMARKAEKFWDTVSDTTA